MTKRPIVTNPTPSLREPSRPIKAEEINSGKIKQLITDLRDTMAVENGIGIAAPQVGENVRVIIVTTEKGPEAFLNPTISQKSFATTDSEEGCLSVPGVYGMVRRPKKVTIEALDEQGQPVTIKAVDLIATIFQHEIDHLDGILFIDKAYNLTKSSHGQVI